MGEGITRDNLGKLIANYSFHFIRWCLLFNTPILPVNFNFNLYLFIYFTGKVLKRDISFLDRVKWSTVQSALSLTTEKHMSL